MNILTEFGKALVSLFKLIFGTRGNKFDTEKMRRDWQSIEDILKSGDSLHAAQAVIKADSYLDNVMKIIGAKGQTFADRLRFLENKFDKNVYQNTWRAHKLRNQIAHEHIEVTAGQARAALSSLRRAASQLGAF